MPKNFHCLAPASELVYISVFHYFDKTIAKAHDPLMLRRRKRNVDLEKVDKDLGQDFYVYETDCLNLTVTSKEWEGITDILTNVIFVGGDAAVEQQHEIEILKFKNTITDQEEQNKGAAEIEKTIKYISRLQHAVQDFQRAHNQLERLLVSMCVRDPVGTRLARCMHALWHVVSFDRLVACHQRFLVAVSQPRVYLRSSLPMSV